MCSRHVLEAIEKFSEIGTVRARKNALLTFEDKSMLDVLQSK